MESNNILNKLNQLATNDADWKNEALWREANAAWLKVSAKIALRILSEMKRKNISQTDLAKAMMVSPQYVNKLVKGRENLSIETISKLEIALGIELLAVPGYEMLEHYSYSEIAEVAEPTICYGSFATTFDWGKAVEAGSKVYEPEECAA